MSSMCNKNREKIYSLLALVSSIEDETGVDVAVDCCKLGVGSLLALPGNRQIVYATLVVGGEVEAG